MVSPLVAGASKAMAEVPLSPLDKGETAAHELAWSAALYQHGSQIDAWVFVALACAGTAIARAPEIIRLIKDRNRPQLAASPPPPKPPEEAKEKPQ